MMGLKLSPELGPYASTIRWVRQFQGQVRSLALDADDLEAAAMSKAFDAMATYRAGRDSSLHGGEGERRYVRAAIRRGALSLLRAARAKRASPQGGPILQFDERDFPVDNPCPLEAQEKFAEIQRKIDLIAERIGTEDLSLLFRRDGLGMGVSAIVREDIPGLEGEALHRMARRYSVRISRIRRRAAKAVRDSE